MDAHAECRGIVTTVGLILPNFKYDLAHDPRIGGGSPASKSGPVSSHAIKFVAECLEELGRDAVPEIKKLQEDKEDFVKRSARAAVRDIDRAK